MCPGLGCHRSTGAHNAQRPLAFPLTARATIEGWDAVTACTADILYPIKVSWSAVCESGTYKG